mgnify:CR=1 FL=1
MRILLFSLSAIFSGIMVFLSYQNLHNEIATVDFTLITLVIIVILSFSGSHFFYKNRCQKRDIKLFNQRLETLEKNIAELTNLKEALEKKVRLMERDLRVANAKALDHTLHIKSTTAHLSGDPEED